MVLTSLRELDFDEVFDTQKAFRDALEAMSRPGTIVSLAPTRFVATPEGFAPHVLVLLKTLCDNQVTFSVGDPSRHDWIRYIEINTATSYVEAAAADYVVFDGSVWSPSFGDLRTGDLEFPEASATALVMVGGLSSNGDGAHYHLRGPGVNGSIAFAVRGLEAAYVDTFRRMGRVSPLGIDLLMVAPDGALVGLPRSVRIEEA